MLELSWPRKKKKTTWTHRDLDKMTQKHTREDEVAVRLSADLPSDKTLTLVTTQMWERSNVEMLNSVAIKSTESDRLINGGRRSCSRLYLLFLTRCVFIGVLTKDLLGFLFFF